MTDYWQLTLPTDKTSIQISPSLYNQLGLGKDVRGIAQVANRGGSGYFLPELSRGGGNHEICFRPVQ